MTEEQPIIGKAASLALQLREEKKRLKEELDALQKENENLTPVAPTGTIDYYIKWVGVILGVTGMFLMNTNCVTFGQISYLISGICWITVGSLWKDTAIMIGSTITTTTIAMNLLEKLIQ
jgi:hypothetical protein